MTAPVRVLVVEDSLTVRKRLVAVLGGAPGLEVVGEAADGKAAIEMCQRLRPDVVTLDLMLPIMSGLAVTEYVMAHCPTPILIVSASTNRGELFRTYEALAAGALDVLEKPLGDEIDGVWERRLVETVQLVSRIQVITHLRGKRVRSPTVPAVPPRAAGVDPSPSAGARSPRVAASDSSGSHCRVVAVGASTGGTAAVVSILQALPPAFSLPILLVIHIGRPFGAAFAEWLDGQSRFRVSYARDGEPLPAPGEARVVMAPPDSHLVLADGKLRLSAEPERHSCRPSADVLFESVARELGDQAAACLLTGMGRDGAQGLLAVRRGGGRTFAQDEATSVVFGMPREAILLGAAERVLPLDGFAPALAALPGAAAGGGA